MTRAPIPSLPWWRRALRRSTLLLAIVALWCVVAWFKLVQPIFLPSPWATLDALAAGLRDGPLWTNFLGTVGHMLYGWVLASLVGIVLGALVGMSRQARVWLQPTLEFLRPLPASAIIPIAVALFGLSQGMVLFVIVYGSVWPIMLSTAHGFQTVEPRLKEVARVLALSHLAYAWKIGLPSALPSILAGMRLSLSIALVISVVAEMMSSQQGLGSSILTAARAYRGPELYAGVILLSLIGCFSGVALRWAETRLAATPENPEAGGA